MSQCEEEKLHALGVCTAIIGNGALFQITCPRCGEVALVTREELMNAIKRALEERGFMNVEEI